MKLINRKVNVWGECPSDPVEMLKWIERAGRVCWKSDDKITEDSYKDFVKMILKVGHGAVLEMSNLVVSNLDYTPDSKYITRDSLGYCGGNVRAWMDYCAGLNTFELLMKRIDALGGRVVPKEDIPKGLKRISVELICDRADTHEIVRHRVMSFLQESQRYVKYETGIEFIKPLWYNDGKENEMASSDFFKHCEASEQVYVRCRKRGQKPQDARVNLPNSCATRILITGNLQEWKGVFALRGSKAKGVYPPVKVMFSEIEDTFKENDWIL